MAAASVRPLPLLRDPHAAGVRGFVCGMRAPRAHLWSAVARHRFGLLGLTPNRVPPNPKRCRATALPNSVAAQPH
jgi:hypothetical protein